MTRGIESPHTNRQCICRNQTALTLNVGVATLCPGRETKSVAAMFVWFFQHPGSSVAHAGVILTREKGGMEMPHYDFNKPMTFLNALEQYALAHQCVMVALRDEVSFGEARDHAILNAAHILTSMLEDARAEASALSDLIERRVLGGF